MEKLTLAGYVSQKTCRTGDQLEFKVSDYSASEYEADLVRVICADRITPAARYKVEEIPSDFSGSYKGIEKDIPIGSYVELDDSSDFSKLDALTVTAHIWPTTAHKGRQFIVSQWDDVAQKGWAMVLDDKGCPALLIGDGAGNVKLISSMILAADKTWTQIAISVDRISGYVQVFAICDAYTGLDAVKDWPYRRILNVPASLIGRSSLPLRVAAGCGAKINGQDHKPVGVFNGKIERVRIWNGVPSEEGFTTFGEELVAMNGEVVPDRFKGDILCDMDFSENIGSTKITDISGLGHHAHIVNTPLRGVTGRNWDGKADDWKVTPEQYGSIYFHDDDLYDCLWNTDFTYKVPEGLRSGHYAVRLMNTDCEAFIPFFVLPENGKPQAKVAFLAATAMYQAYANYILGINLTHRFPKVHNNQAHDNFIEAHPEIGPSLYCFHRDGTEINYSTDLRPHVNHQPGSQGYNYSSDWDITDWMEQEAIEYDVITDKALNDEGLALLEGYDVVVTGVHPEYYSPTMLDAVESYTSSGGRLMYMGGNGFFWKVAYNDEMPHAIELRRAANPGEEHHAFDGERGSLWWPEFGKPTQPIVGVGLSGAMVFFGPQGYNRLEDSHNPRAAFIFDGVAKDEVIGNFGNHFGGAAGEEVDRVDYENGTTPAYCLHLARSDAFPEVVDEEPGIDHDDVRADMIFMEKPGGGAVFATGSIAWSSALEWDDYDNNVARITGNVLRRFMDDTPFEMPKT